MKHTEHGKKSRLETVRSSTEYPYTAVFAPAEEGGYIVTVRALPGLVTEGDTLDEARLMAQDAIRGCLDGLRKDGEEIPIEQGDAIIERVAVTLSRA